MPRLFFALWPDPPTRTALAMLVDGLPLVGGRRVPAENLHLTLAFLGNVDEGAAAAARVALRHLRP